MAVAINTISEATIYENKRNKINYDLLLFAIPLLIYYLFNYSRYEKDSLPCLIISQLISLASIYLISQRVKVNLAELYFNSKYKAFAKNTLIFILIALVLLGSSHTFIAPPSLFAAAVITAPIFEELVFRGFLYNFLSYMIKSKSLVFVINSALFTTAHYIYAGDSQTMLVVFFIGIASCYLRNRYNSLIPCTYVHLLNNLAVFLK